MLDKNNPYAVIVIKSDRTSDTPPCPIPPREEVEAARKLNPSKTISIDDVKRLLRHAPSSTT